jgi:hypothetical protein
MRHLLKQRQHRRRRIPAQKHTTSHQTHNPTPTKKSHIKKKKKQKQKQKNKGGERWDLCRSVEVSSSLMETFLCFLFFSNIVALSIIVKLAVKQRTLRDREGEKGSPGRNRIGSKEEVRRKRPTFAERL